MLALMKVLNIYKRNSLSPRLQPPRAGLRLSSIRDPTGNGSQTSSLNVMVAGLRSKFKSQSKAQKISAADNFDTKQRVWSASGLSTPECSS